MQILAEKPTSKVLSFDWWDSIGWPVGDQIYGDRSYGDESWLGKTH